MKTKLSSGKKSKLYFPQLDSIRGISFIAIFLFHTLRINDKYAGEFLKYLFNNLPLAIDVFFILSSFLLTYLALDEYKKKGNFSFQNYFTRRVLRIWPLYYFILIVAFILMPLAANWFHYKMTLPDPIYYLLFIANFYTISHVFFLKLLWTISVEEQFYLLWGFCLRFFHKNLYVIITILFLISISYTVYTICTGRSYYLNSLTYLFDFASGALGALLIFKNKITPESFSYLSKKISVLFYCYLPLHFTLFYFLEKNTTGIASDLVGLLSRYFFIIYIATFIIEQMINVKKTLILVRNKFLIYTGKISYGLYCYHGIAILVINLLFQHFNIEINNWLLVLLYFSLNYFIATISYFYLETPFLKLKDKWRRI